jgi:hypothetical protein
VLFSISGIVAATSTMLMAAMAATKAAAPFVDFLPTM